MLFFFINFFIFFGVFPTKNCRAKNLAQQFFSPFFQID